jgi:hypothetical protein
MTKEDIQFLSEFESNFKTAINSNYSRNIVKSKLEKMLEIYKRVTGRNYSLCTHCTTSILTFLRLIGELYFDTVQDGTEPNLKINELQKTVTDMENKKKKNRKKNE